MPKNWTTLGGRLRWAIERQEPEGERRGVNQFARKMEQRSSKLVDEGEPKIVGTGPLHAEGVPEGPTRAKTPLSSARGQPPRGPERVADLLPGAPSRALRRTRCGQPIRPGAPFRRRANCRQGHLQIDRLARGESTILVPHVDGRRRRHPSRRTTLRRNSPLGPTTNSATPAPQGPRLKARPSRNPHRVPRW